MLPVCWLLPWSAHQRDPLLLDGGDTLLLLLLFWSLFLPLGTQWSVAPERSGRGTNLAAETALLLQPVLMYVCAALFKLLQPDWRDGTAVGYVLQQLYWIRPAGAWLAEWPWLTAPLT